GSRSPCRASSCRTNITAIPATCRNTAIRRSRFALFRGRGSVLHGAERGVTCSGGIASDPAADRGGLRRLDETVPLVEELEHALAAFEVGRARRQIEATARTRQWHFQHLPDARGRTVGHHHDAVGE